MHSTLTYTWRLAGNGDRCLRAADANFTRASAKRTLRRQRVVRRPTLGTRFSVVGGSKIKAGCTICGCGRLEDSLMQLFRLVEMVWYVFSCMLKYAKVGCHGCGGLLRCIVSLRLHGACGRLRKPGLLAVRSLQGYFEPMHQRTWTWMY